MRLKQLKLEKFGPFSKYIINFNLEENACLLLTGKNNEGKSSIISSLRLLNSALKVLNKKKQEINISGDYYYKLLVQDVENINIGRMIYDYKSDFAKIYAEFDNGFMVTVYLDSKREQIYADYEGRIPDDINSLLGFIPPLGLLNESEDLISKMSYLKANIDTTLAPRHLRNYFYQLLNESEFKLVQEIIKKSWAGIELVNYEYDIRKGKVYCYYKENTIDREISWAGQGLQVWFQIITHLVRLLNVSILILDEPEINLHPEKQNELITILRENYNGSIIIATHSVELMNNVNVDSIIHVQKKALTPRIKSTSNRFYLDSLRSQIGSNFNLIASQFEICDLILFTEDDYDYRVLKDIMDAFNIHKKIFNIPLHGFCEYTKAKIYREAYYLLIGKSIPFSMVLDRDYYPESYLKSIKSETEKDGIHLLFTHGKEIENYFLHPSILKNLFGETLYEQFNDYWTEIVSSIKEKCYADFIALHKQKLDPKYEINTIITEYSAIFNKCWNDPKRQHLIVDGKAMLKKIKNYYRKVTGQNLNQSMLIQALIQSDKGDLKHFIEEVLHIKEVGRQTLHY